MVLPVQVAGTLDVVGAEQRPASCGPLPPSRTSLCAGGRGNGRRLCSSFPLSFSFDISAVQSDPHPRPRDHSQRGRPPVGLHNGPHDSQAQPSAPGATRATLFEHLLALFRRTAWPVILHVEPVLVGADPQPGRAAWLPRWGDCGGHTRARSQGCRGARFFARDDEQTGADQAHG